MDGHAPGERPGTLLIVGLGNPGRKYRRHRHNVGFMMLEDLAGRCGLDLDSRRHLSLIGTGVIEGRRAVLAEPLTYMNQSGEAVSRLVRYFHVAPGDLIVLHDDLDMTPGKIRIKIGGGHGGHNGLRSIVQALGHGDFRRIKVGIGRPPEGVPAERWVLTDFTSDEWSLIEQSLERSIDILMGMIAPGAGTVGDGPGGRTRG